MKKMICKMAAVLAGCGLAGSAAYAAAVGTAFTFQGELSDGGAAVSDACDFEFTLWDDPAGGGQVGGVVAQTIDVADGLFTTSLDFGAGIFTGDARWLQIDVCCPSPCSPALTPLDPRQELTPAPYALHAANAPDGHSLDAVDGDPVDALFVDADGKVGIGTTAPTQMLSVEGAVIAMTPAPTPPGSSVGLGTPSGNPGVAINLGDGAGNSLQRWDLQIEGDQSFQVRDSTTPATRLTITTDGDVGVGTDMPTERLTVTGTVESTAGGFKFPDGTLQSTAAMGGGGNTLDAAYDQGGAGAGRVVTADTGPVEIAGPDGLVVAGTIQSGSSIIIDGTARTMTSDGDVEFHVADGRALRLQTNATSPNVIGGFSGNEVTSGAAGATIGGGGQSGFINQVSGNFATVGGGDSNTANEYATVGGGSGNTAGSSATVGGGASNTASGLFATVGGGDSNTASRLYSTVPGGRSNSAGGAYSFAAGRRAIVRDGVFVGDSDGDEGTFVWADSTNANFISTGPNQFLIRAAGGVGIGTSSPSATLDVDGSLEVDGSTLVVDAANNRVGIGTPSPSRTLDVEGSVQVDGSTFIVDATNNRVSIVEGSSAFQLAVRASTALNGIRGYATQSSSSGVYGLNDSTSGTGVFGVATASSGTNYGVRGFAGSPSGFDFFASGIGTDYGAASSIRWKRNIRNIDGPLEKIERLRGVYYDWDAEHGGHHDVGMIAEEVGKVLPEIVAYEENGTDAIGMDYSKLTPLLVEAVKAQSQQIAELEALNSELQARDAELAARNEELEQRLARIERWLEQSENGVAASPQ